MNMSSDSNNKSISNESYNCMNDVSILISEAKDVKQDFEEVNQPKYTLNNISFKIKEGESCAFVGETGSGKSTIIRLL